MPFRPFEALHTFTLTARHPSFTSAAAELNLTKGAVSYQIRRLENALGFAVFVRRPGGIALTEKGNRLWHASELAFHGLEQEIARLRNEDTQRITVGMTTYFASRWLSPRLMNFMTGYPKIGLRLQPLVGLVDLRAEKIDLAIRWGNGDWTDLDIELLLRCPAKPTAGASIAGRIRELGMAAALADLTLLHDRDGSEAWLDWHKAAGLSYQPRRGDLVIPDPNVRVQAVIDGQGVALNDSLVSAEFATGQLFQISSVELSDYGYYLCYPPGALDSPAVNAFRDWIVAEAGGLTSLP